MSELERYGVAPRYWNFNEEERELVLVTDLVAITVKLTKQQVEEIKAQFTFARIYFGRVYRDGMLCIPAKEHKEEQSGNA